MFELAVIRARPVWNKDKLVGQKLPFRPSEFDKLMTECQLLPK